MITPEQLHEWYLEATKELSEYSFNKNAQKPYNKLTAEQKFIDEYIADKINEALMKTKSDCRIKLAINPKRFDDSILK